MKKIAGLAGAVAALLLLSSSAFALGLTTVYFNNITNNDPSGVNVASQLSMDIAEIANVPNQVNFIFHNSAENPISSSIAEVYFDDGSLLGISSISGTGVNFSIGANPNNLPGWATVSPVFKPGSLLVPGSVKAFTVDAGQNARDNGVGVGDELIIKFNLLPNKTYADTIAMLNTGELRIGLHVVSIGTTEKSDSFVNRVPEPGTFMILTGCLTLGLVYRRKLQD